MPTVFIAGSLSIKRLHPLFVDRIDTVVKSGFGIVIGDADGADTSIQQALSEREAHNVTVYCSGDSARNNIGNWPIESVHPKSEPGSRAFFTAKDIEMAKVADYGLMIWDAKSIGTLSNVIELLRREHSSRVFLNKEKQFFTVSNAEELKQLIGTMSTTAHEKAEAKIGLSAKVASIAHRQLSLSL